MIVPDLNLLLYAHIDTFPQHRDARRWWEQVVAEGRPIGLCAPVVFGFVRIATNPRIFSPPMGVPEAIATVRGWLALPRVRWLVASPDHPELAFELLEQAGSAANLCTDAQIAAYAIEHHAAVATNDTDFGRFSGVKVTNPLERRS